VNSSRAVEVITTKSERREVGTRGEQGEVGTLYIEKEDNDANGEAAIIVK
jgi:hypothetical protein